VHGDVASSSRSGRMHVSEPRINARKLGHTIWEIGEGHLQVGKVLRRRDYGRKTTVEKEAGN
jgi:hypothetical protein